MTTQEEKFIEMEMQIDNIKNSLAADLERFKQERRRGMSHRIFEWYCPDCGKLNTVLNTCLKIGDVIMCIKCEKQFTLDIKRKEAPDEQGD